MTADLVILKVVKKVKNNKHSVHLLPLPAGEGEGLSLLPNFEKEGGCWERSGWPFSSGGGGGGAAVFTKKKKKKMKYLIAKKSL